MEHRTRQILMGTGALLAGASAVSLAATKYMVDIALNRQEPKITGVLAKRQIQGFDIDAAFLAHLEVNEKQLRSRPHRVVTITAFDGEPLIGHWFTCQKPQRIIVAMHGWRSGWSRDFGSISRFWEENGCGVLYAEQRGQGLSGGAYMGFGMMERYDCLQWARWVNTQYPRKLPIYLAGVSMGASTVLMAAELDLPQNVKGILADCGFTSAHEIWRHVAKNNLHIPYGVPCSLVNGFCKRRLHVDPKQCSTKKALAGSHIPVLFAHGAQDHFVPVEMTLENYQICGSPKRLLIVPGADHGMSHYLCKERYEQMMLDFFRDFDK